MEDDIRVNLTSMEICVTCKNVRVNKEMERQEVLRAMSKLKHGKTGREDILSN